MRSDISIIVKILKINLWVNLQTIMMITGGLMGRPLPPLIFERNAALGRTCGR